ncbi:hypothetical protein QT381_04240 [Galbitalea sp. SE-J8]|uniref:membrane protein YczE n=1 Tax=Galbitalea sp. SE-J8 TaxID=3054952 RepID=UPI00259D27CC|nr:hypothetical protein [Galbitalea sp. SE-J8]MDM4762213.1 hypothetical protein [Galbitalea sp. SE-J8]
MLARRLTQLLVGLFVYGIAIAMMVRAEIGVEPWDVLTLGIDRHSGWGFGLLTNLIGLTVLLLWIPLRQRPGVGTVLNILLVGPSAEVGLWLIPHPPLWWQQWLLFAGGMVVLAIASGLYIGARLGPGPRDGLMTGVVARTGWPIWIVRTAIEASVLLGGWLLGGNVGLGTIAVVLGIGPLVGFTIPRMRIPERPRRGPDDDGGTAPVPSPAA